jgi:predicted RNA-binding Zn-ribbon protein involved in translation (DUF1610 family)
MPTKAELLAEATALGLAVDDSMTKDEIQAAIDAANAAPEEVERVCAQCGEPAIWRTTNKAVNEVFYCNDHGLASGEAMEPLDQSGSEEEPAP